MTASRPDSRLRPQAIESPCVGICVIEPGSGCCRGCGRTIDEIASWPTLSAEQRRNIMSGLASRVGSGEIGQ